MTLFLRRSTLTLPLRPHSLTVRARASTRNACQCASNATADPAVVAPNANLHLEGIPPIPVNRR